MAAVHHYRADIVWQREGADFPKGRYSRAHVWRFDSGVEVRASSSPLIVPKPWSAEDAVDPEEAFVASLSSCHVLTFLDLARRAGFLIDRYEDAAEGEMVKNADGRYWIATVTLRPRIAFAGNKHPAAAELEHLHHAAHDQCFISSSVKTEVRVLPAA